MPIIDFVRNADICFKEIKKGKGAFPIPEIEEFLDSFSIISLKAKSKLKNDITIQIEDLKTYLSPSLGFSIKSQLGKVSTLVNASGATNFTFILGGNSISHEEVNKINGQRTFSDKFEALDSLGVSLQFEKADNKIFRSNLQTIDYNFEKIIAEILIYYYSNNDSSLNTIEKLIEKVARKNTIGYDLDINSSMYELIMKKFLTDYALGMRAAEVWKRNYQATGGYLVVRTDGEIVCYHFYFTKNFEDYLFNNTKLDTPDPKKHKFGQVYLEDGNYKIKLNLQVRFTK